ncbi:MAG TPA: hypothetical protein PLB09_09365 [Deltaproteobacteria bacterium]|nr:hypothetical protein [Deltaproteobacteria bacterium]HPJ08221.1 hypothetical protein [Deltaproteobacteria bacterium]
MRDRQGKIKVGLKYCGGCRAQYDRVGLVTTLRERLADDVEFVAADSEDAEMILIVSGCSSACTRLDAAHDCPTRYVTSPEDAQRWVDELRADMRGRSGR